MKDPLLIITFDEHDDKRIESRAFSRRDLCPCELVRLVDEFLANYRKTPTYLDHILDHP